MRRLIANSPIHYSEYFEVDVAEFYRRACTMGLEGLVSKQRNGRYQSDRTDTWRKVTCRRRETLRIVGYAMKDDRFEGLYLAREEEGELLYAGKVHHGLSRDSTLDVMRRLKPLIQPTQALTKKVKKPKAIWVKPDLLAEIEYRAQTETGKLRHPSFKGLREDLA